MLKLRVNGFSVLLFYMKEFGKVYFEIVVGDQGLEYSGQEVVDEVKFSSKESFEFFIKFFIQFQRGELV